MIIAVEGIDGSGKSSLIKKISETYENVYTFSISDFVKHYYSHDENIFKGTSHPGFCNIYELTYEIAKHRLDFVKIVERLHEDMRYYAVRNSNHIGMPSLCECFETLKHKQDGDGRYVYNAILHNYAHIMFMLSKCFLNHIQNGPRFKRLKEYFGKYQEPIIILDRWYCSTLAYNTSIDNTMVSNFYKEGADNIFTNSFLNNMGITVINPLYYLFNSTVPDYLIYLDVDPDTALDRIGKRGSAEPFESKDKLERVRKTYLDLVESYQHPHSQYRKVVAKDNEYVVDFKVAKNPVITLDTIQQNENEVFNECKKYLNVILNQNK